MDEMGTTLDIIRLIVGVSVLSYASYTDIKTRRASNINWLIMGGIGGILLVVQYFTVGFENYLYLLFIPIMIGLVYTFFQMRLIFGGADAKALMAIAILTPLEPSINQFPLWSGSFMPFSWSIFSNSIQKETSNSHLFF
jgi:preflagellin peptidase FlaK